MPQQWKKEAGKSHANMLGNKGLAVVSLELTGCPDYKVRQGCSA